MAGILARFRAGWADPKLNGARGMPVWRLANIPSQDRPRLIPPVLAPVLAPVSGALVLASTNHPSMPDVPIGRRGGFRHASKQSWFRAVGDGASSPARDAFACGMSAR
jgi:hypothetical protein